jgi:hypothetical protein
MAGELLAELFPNGILPYALGGLLIGLGASVIYVTTGIIAGASSFLESTLSYVSELDQFNRRKFLSTRRWRLVFTAGIVLGAFAYTVTLGDGFWTTEVQPWRLAIGGVLVGIGTRLGRGCTSGHGVCGVGSASWTSIINVGTFLLVAIATAQLVQLAGVTP